MIRMGTNDVYYGDDLMKLSNTSNNNRGSGTYIYKESPNATMELEKFDCVKFLFGMKEDIKEGNPMKTFDTEMN